MEAGALLLARVLALLYAFAMNKNHNEVDVPVAMVKSSMH